jgi:SAM-dependent methyltransferase
VLENTMSDEDIPSPIDFHDLAQAREWEANTVRRRPWRRCFFDAFVAALNDRFVEPFTVLELGSGPGHLAEQILERCTVTKYTALDFSAAMHQIARRRLSAFVERADFVEQDYRSPGWAEGLGVFDAVVTMQAAHEVRHIRHLVPFLARARQLLTNGGLFLYCDHYSDNGMNPALYLDRRNQPNALLEAGFSNVRKLWDEGGMALYSAESSS